MKRLTILFMLLFLGLVADANAEDDGQLEAAKKAGEAAAKAAAKKNAKAKNKTEGGKSKKNALSFGGDMSWGKAANSKQTRATAPGHEIKAHWDAALDPWPGLVIRGSNITARIVFAHSCFIISTSIPIG